MKTTQNKIENEDDLKKHQQKLGQPQKIEDNLKKNEDNLKKKMKTTSKNKK